MRRSTHIYYYFEYVLIWIFLKFLLLFPFKLRVNVGQRVLSTVLYYAPPAKKRTKQNLAFVWPDLTEDDQNRIRKQVAQTFGATLTEILNNKPFGQQANLFQATGEGLDVIKNLPEGKGFILVSAHFGAWESPRAFLKQQGIEIGAVYRRSNNPYFDKEFLKQLKYGGEPIFAKGRRGTTDLVRHIRAGGSAAIMIDQKYRRGEMIDFLGKPASTSLAPAELALKYDVPLIPVSALRREDNSHIDIHFDSAIPPTDALTMMQEANARLSQIVTKHPGQWYWFHNRWN